MNPENKISVSKTLLIVIIVGIIVVGVVVYNLSLSEKSGTESDLSYDQRNLNSENCNVTVFSLNGELHTYTSSDVDEYGYALTSSEDIVYGLSVNADDPQTKAVIISVDSYGGYGPAGEEIANALKRFSKPNVAVIRSIGASAAYWAATGADKIYASRVSDVGSIGVTQSYVDQTAKDAIDGYKYIELNSAKHKDLLNPSRPISEEEKQILLAELKKYHDIFVEDVAKNRNLKIEDVAKLANGLSFLGADALEYGLIDEIGDFYSATQYLENLIGEPVELCWY